jgi:hypothetical protein
MDILLDHLERTARQSTSQQDGKRQFVQGFLQDAPPQWQSITVRMNYPREAILLAMDRCLAYEKFERGRGPDYGTGRIQARFERIYNRNEGWLSTVSGLLSTQLALRFEVRIEVEEDGTVRLEISNRLPTWVSAFVETVCRQLQDTPPEQMQGHTMAVHNPVLGPGEELTAAYSGRLLDYSGCASLREVEDLIKRKGDDKVLPLGIFAFDHKPELAGHQPPLLCLSRYRNNALMAYNGTLIVAPQNSGKTELILRWALAANRSGYSTFIVDVKGDMYHRLTSEGLQGRVFYFSTDPDPRLKCQKLNFLEGLDPLTASGRKQIDQLVESILPQEGNEEGEDLEYWRVRTKWLSALINIRRLLDRYYCITSDLGDIYDLASNEENLYSSLRSLKTAEQHQRENSSSGAVGEPGFSFWIAELAVLIAPGRQDIPGGQREPRYSYSTLTINITTALKPFCKHGTLYSRTSGRGDFTLMDLDGVEQATIILAAREQDGEDSRTVVSMAIKRLEQILFERRKRAKPDHDVLLLLDETRRIRRFKAGEYITFARDAKAGCVLVYQSIAQIRSEQEVIEILENVGTQIYLRSLTGATATRFIEMLPKRERPRFSLGSSQGSDGFSKSMQMGQEQVDYLSTSELYRLPAGNYPALVYIKDHGEGKPILVDMDKERLRQSMSLLY